MKEIVGRNDSPYNPVWCQETKTVRNVSAKLDENFISIEFTSLPANSSPFCDIHLTYKKEYRLQLQLICLFILRPLTYPPPHHPSSAWRPHHRYCSSLVEQVVWDGAKKALFSVMQTSYTAVVLLYVRFCEVKFIMQKKKAIFRRLRHIAKSDC